MHCCRGSLRCESLVSRGACGGWMVNPTWHRRLRRRGAVLGGIFVLDVHGGSHDRCARFGDLRSPSPACGRGRARPAHNFRCEHLAPLVLRATGIEGRAPLFVALGFVTLGLLSLWRLDDLHATDTNSRQAILRLVRRPPMLLVAAFLGGLFESGPSTFLPLQALQVGWSATQATLIVSALGLGGFVAPWPLGVQADRIALHRLFSRCSTAMLAGSLAAASAVCAHRHMAHRHRIGRCGRRNIHACCDQREPAVFGSRLGRRDRCSGLRVFAGRGDQSGAIGVPY